MLYFCWYKFSRLRDTIPMLCLRSLKYITFPLFVSVFLLTIWSLQHSFSSLFRISETHFLCSFSDIYKFLFTLSDIGNTDSLLSFWSLQLQHRYSLLFRISATQILCFLSDLYNYNTDTDRYSLLFLISASLQHSFSSLFLFSATQFLLALSNLGNTVSLRSF